MCGISCSSRDVALVHFRDIHADTSMVCVVCDMLFDDATKILNHYSSQHPNHLPPKLKDVIMIILIFMFCKYRFEHIT